MNIGRLKKKRIEPDNIFLFNTEPESLIRELKYIILRGVIVKSRLIGRVLRKWLLINGFLLFVVIPIFSQTNGDFQTVGPVNFSAATNWQTYNSGWIPAVTAPVQGDGIITIRSGHTATVNLNVTLDQVIVASGGILRVNATRILSIADGPGSDLSVSGTVNNFGTITPTGTIIFSATGIYNHSRNGGAIPNATWDPLSNCNITGVTNTMPTGFSQTFGNFTWDCPGNVGQKYLQANMNVNGNFSVLSTGTPFDPNTQSLRISNTAVGYTINVAGNFVIDNNSTFKMNNGTGSCILSVGGNFTLSSGSYFTIVTGNANSTFSVAGDVNILGTLDMQEESSMTGTLNVGGDFTLAGSGIIQESASGSGIINFNGITPQTYLNTGGIISNTINFNVNNGSVLDVGTSLIDGSDGNFILNAGAGIITAHEDGLSSDFGVGSIQVGGSISLDTGADYTYNGSVSQVTGNALPNTVRNLTINNSNGVSLINGVTVNGTLTLTSGEFNLNGNAFIISSTGVVTCAGTGTIYGDGGSSFTINSNTATNFPDGIYQDATIDSPGGVTLCGNATINGTLEMISGNITTGPYTLFLANQVASSLNHTTGVIIGKFERGINETGTFLFPVGTATSYNPANLVINSYSTGGSVLSEFMTNDPGNSGLPVTDGGVVVAVTSPEGYWSFTANSFSSGDYNIDLNGNGFSPSVDGETRILKRISGGPWGLDGTHGIPSGSVCYRNNLSGNISSSGTHFALGHRSPVITDQPDDLTVCEGSNVSFSISANGYGTITYRWYKAPGTLLIEGGRFTGTQTATLNISGVVLGDDGNYYCIVTDGNSNSLQSTSAQLTVRSQPVAQAITKLPNVSDVCVTEPYQLPSVAVAAESARRMSMSRV